MHKHPHAITRQQLRRNLWRTALDQVRARDLNPVIRQAVQVGWQGDTRAERRKQARALAKKWWKERSK